MTETVTNKSKTESRKKAENNTVYQNILNAVHLQNGVDFMSDKFDEFQINHNELVQENIIPKKVVKEIKKVNKALKHRVNSLEQDFKQNNILLTGIMLQPEENTMQVVKKVLDTIGTSIENVTEAHRVNGKTRHQFF